MGMDPAECRWVKELLQKTRKPVNGLLPLLLTAMLLSPTLVLSLPAQILAGKPEILDGDTLRFGSERVRLEGVDALESRQHCLDSGGKRYRCGLSAREALKEAIGSRPVRCEGSQRGPLRPADCGVF